MFFGIAHDLAAVKFRGVVGLLGGGLQFVQIGKAGLYALDLAAQAGQFKIAVGFAVQLDGVTSTNVPPEFIVFSLIRASTLSPSAETTISSTSSTDEIIPSVKSRPRTNSPIC